MTTRIRINYVERELDHKIPRPHHVTIDDDGNALNVQDGEIGPLRMLLGFCPDVTPNVDDWVVFKPSEVAALPLVAAGLYPQFVDTDGTMFGYDWQVESVEVLG